MQAEQRAQYEAMRPQWEAMAAGTLRGKRKQQAGHMIVEVLCQCGVRFGVNEKGPTGDDASIIHCSGCGSIWKLQIEG